jgi:hypothetical protein
MAATARAVLASASDCCLPISCLSALESFYEVPRDRVAELMRAAIALPTIESVDPLSLLRALEIYEHDRLDFAEA